MQDKFADWVQKIKMMCVHVSSNVDMFWSNLCVSTCASYLETRGPASYLENRGNRHGGRSSEGGVRPGVRASTTACTCPLFFFDVCLCLFRFVVPRPFATIVRPFCGHSHDAVCSFSVRFFTLLRCGRGAAMVRPKQSKSNKAAKQSSKAKQQTRAAKQSNNGVRFTCFP